MGKLNNKLRKGVLLCTVLALCVGANTLQAEGARKNVWLKESGKTYYCDKKGRKVTGLKKIKGKRYFFDKKGVLYKKGWKTIRGKKYYFKKNTGAAATGAVKIRKKKYLFNDKGQLVGTGLQKYGKKRYYTKKGVIQTGLKTVKGKTYYFTSKGPAAKGWKRVKGKKYYFGSNGAAATGTQTIGGKTYQFSKKGELLKVLSTTQSASENNPNPGAGQETPDQTSDPSQNTQRPKRPVEPVVQDPSVTVPTVNPVENTKENMNEAYSKLNQAINQSKSYVESWEPADWEPTGYTNFMAVFGEAKAMFEATEDVIQEDRKWNLVFDASKGTFVNKQREFDPINYPYTATELLQEVEKLKSYKEQCLKLQRKQVLTYYPEQSKAIFDAINEYRTKNGLLPMIWSEKVQKVSRLECGFRVVNYKESDDINSQEWADFMGHSYAQIAMTMPAGFVGVKSTVNGWIESPNHKVALDEPGTIYAGVAYYTYNSATTGVTWSKVILTTWLQDEEPTYSDGSTITTAPERLWPTLLNCEINDTVIP